MSPAGRFQMHNDTVQSNVFFFVAPPAGGGGGETIPLLYRSACQKMSLRGIRAGGGTRTETSTATSLITYREEDTKRKQTKKKKIQERMCTCCVHVVYV